MNAGKSLKKQKKRLFNMKNQSFSDNEDIRLRIEKQKFEKRRTNQIKKARQNAAFFDNYRELY